MSKFINRSNRANLGLETLGLRAMPAVMVSQLDLDNDGGADDIMIVGDNAKNVVSIKDDGVSKLTVSVDANGDGDFTDPGELDNVTYNYTGRLAIAARMGGGKDGFGYELAGPLTSRVRDLDINMGKGADTVNVVAGDLQSSIFGGAQLDVDVATGKGNDTVNVTTGKADGSLVGLRIDLGAGNDKGSVKFDQIDNGASVDVDADLGHGDNTFEVDIQTVGKFQHADADIRIVGGVNVDQVAVNLHDDVGGGAAPGRSTLTIDADLGDGNDTFIASMDAGGSGFRVDDQSLVAISARGGKGNDVLQARADGVGTIRIDPFALLAIDLDGGAGNDELSATFGLPDTLWIEGGLKVRMNGGNGADKIAALFANTANTTGNYDVAVSAGAGDDEVTFSLVNNGGTPTFKPKGVVLDGGSGNDKLIDLAKAISAETFFETII